MLHIFWYLPGLSRGILGLEESLYSSFGFRYKNLLQVNQRKQSFMRKFINLYLEIMSGNNGGEEGSKARGKHL